MSGVPTPHSELEERILIALTWVPESHRSEPRQALRSLVEQLQVAVELDEKHVQQRDELQEQLEAADAALQWIAENHRKAILEMPTPIYRLLRKPSASSLASASALAARNDETAEAEESSPAKSPSDG